MQLILKPIAEREIGEIIVTDAVFPVGRHEDPFAGYPRDLVAKLSKRHARIFEENGKVYVADLGSTNGTTLNGVEVGRTPMELQRGDELCFTKLRYEVELLGGGLVQADPAPTGKVSLVLTPENPQSGLEPIVVSHFPFLVSRDGAAFAKFKASHPDQLSFISRRHAHLFLKGSEVFIEDLGSINGTYVAGERLAEHAQSIADGAPIAFGGDHFVYRVHVLRPDEDTLAGDADSVVLTGTLPGLEDPTRTTFITSPDSFIDIYYREDGATDEGDEKDESAVESEPTSPMGLRMHRARTLWRALRAALGGEAPGRPWVRWAALGVLIVAGGAALGWYVYNAPVRAIDACVVGADPACAARLAKALLAERPDDVGVQKRSVRAVVDYTVPRWVAALEDNDFALADRVLAEARDLAALTPDVDPHLAFMTWATALEVFVAERGGAAAPLRLFREEVEIEALVEEWDAHKQGYQRTSGEIGRWVEEFAPASLAINSHRTTLAAKLDAEVAASSRLDAELASILADGKVADLGAALDQFAADYPAVTGVDDARAEASLYAEISSDVTNGRWLVAKQKLEVTTFTTPSLAIAANTLQTELPPNEVAGEYGAAFDAWRSGELSESLAMLAVLADGPWGAIANRELSRRQAIVEAFEQLQAKQGQESYSRELLTFYRDLDPDQDRFIANRLAVDYQAAVARVVSNAENGYADARTAWERYQSNGPIDSEDRTAKSVSAHFKSLAALLRVAYTRSGESLAGYAAATIPPSESGVTLQGEVLGEICRQRDIMNDWREVDASYEVKLGLLPVPDC
jgi:pSer/pThr/pTyr-binding forkhead associated (FHA) protein